MKKLCLLMYSLFVVIISFAQTNKNEILLTINDKQISKEEFVRIYEKNRTNHSTGEITSVDKYLDLFINFKLKVLEAEKLAYDTLSSFINEFEGYRQQLARPYLLDNKVYQKIIREAYDRMLYEIRASHILIKLSPDAVPKDTLSAFQKAMQIRQRIIEGEVFEEVARGSSDDPSVKNNGGDLGYFTVFQMIYPFESAAYNSKIGDITFPVRTRFGYHIVKVVDKRKSTGEIKVAHIMLTLPRGSGIDIEDQKKLQISELYHKLKQGDNFSELAKQYSDDKGSAREGGELPWFGVGRMVPEFEQAAFNLKTNGEISQPIKTGFGWHLIQRIDRKEIPSFEEARAEIERKVGKDQRSEIARKALVSNLKVQYHFNEKSVNKPVVYDTIQHDYMVKLKYLNDRNKLDDTLFTFLNKVVFEKEYIEFVKNRTQSNSITGIHYNALYEEFVEIKILELEDLMLAEKYPDYKYLVKEYHDGMLLFEITDDIIWSKAMNDSIGLNEYFEKNRKNYMWDERWDGSLYFCSNENVYKKVKKIINKSSFSEKLSNQDLLKQFNIESETIKIETGLFNKQENKVVDKLIWNSKNSASTDLVLYKGNKVAPQEKSFNEAKGLIISDYQDYLEKEWLTNLKTMYNIQVDNEVLSSIKKTY